MTRVTGIIDDRARGQEAFLRGFHRRHPGVTERAFGRGRVAGGGSSYDALARRVVAAAAALPAGVIIDLGCGDGGLLAAVAAGGGVGRALVGIDLSGDELRLARARAVPATWVQARAQVLPVAGGAAAMVVSHLAFTLMAEPEVVAGELARVLAPGGRFATVVGGGPRGDDAYAGFLELAAPVARATGGTVPRLGELRARSEAGLRALFAPAAGWGALTVDDLAVDLSGTPDELWTTLATLYELDGVPADPLAGLRADFEAATPRWRRPDGRIACTMATTLVETIRR